MSQQPTPDSPAARAVWADALAGQILQDEQMNAEQALDLITSLAVRTGLASACWGPADIEAELSANRREPGSRTLTDAEWRRVTDTHAWQDLPEIAYINVGVAGAVHLAMRQAALECAVCGDPLPADALLTDTWGLCQRHRPVDPSMLQRHDCYASSRGHDFTDRHNCQFCGIPSPAGG